MRNGRGSPWRRGKVLWLVLALLLLAGGAVLAALSPPGRMAEEGGTCAPPEVWLPAAMPSAGDELPILPPVPSPAPTEEEQRMMRAKEVLGGMTLEEKVYQLFLITPEQLTGISSPVVSAGEITRKALEQRPVGGMIYFAGNLVDQAQCEEMLTRVQSFSKLGLFLSVDEEGGAVARVGRNKAMGTTAFPPMGTVGAAVEPDAASTVGRTIGAELRALGFNLNFAPVADVNTNPVNPVIGSRAFSSDPVRAAELVDQAVRGFHESGMPCVLKHFPGHGDTAGDSHSGYVYTAKTLEELERTEFLPFQAGIAAGADMVMAGHIAAPKVTGDDLPATLSHLFLTEILRGKLKFDGVIVTDALEMGAITGRYDSAQAAVLALKAGADLLLMPADLDGAVEGILRAIELGELNEARLDESVVRILNCKIRWGILSPAE